LTRCEEVLNFFLSFLSSSFSLLSSFSLPCDLFLNFLLSSSFRNYQQAPNHILVSPFPPPRGFLVSPITTRRVADHQSSLQVPLPPFQTSRCPHDRPLDHFSAHLKTLQGDVQTFSPPRVEVPRFFRSFPSLQAWEHLQII